MVLAAGLLLARGPAGQRGYFAIPAILCVRSSCIFRDPKSPNKSLMRALS
jgi:hypothetical protein